MEIAIALLLLSGVGVVWLDRTQRAQRYKPYQEDEVQMIRTLYQLHLSEGTSALFFPAMELVQRQIWQKEQEKFAKEASLNVDPHWFRDD